MSEMVDYGKQVEKEHYGFRKYISKRRWASLWHQLDEVISAKAENVLEVGPGAGVFQALASLWGIKVDTIDIDPELNPTYVASADSMPFKSGQYDAVCAFQMLEHLPYERSLMVFREMSRVAAKYVMISLPDLRPAWSYSFYIPAFGDLKFIVPRPWFRAKELEFNGEHYWEVNARGYGVSKVSADLCRVGSIDLLRTYRVREFPYHRFFLFMVRSTNA